jgi:HMG (high mobility group) box
LQSAYNFFFRDERERILSDGLPDDGIVPDNRDPNYWSDERQYSLLRAHWGRDRTVKRRHRKSHGKISFAKLSKSISAAWRALPEEHKNFYREVASKDWERYHRELTQHKLELTAAAVNESLKQNGGSIPMTFQTTIG